MKIMVTGHRPNKVGGYSPNSTQTNIRERLSELLKSNLDKYGSKLECITGMALGVDQWFAEECIKLNIPFVAYVPCKGQDKIWPLTSQKIYLEIILRAKDVKTLSKEYTATCMNERNTAMVDDCDACIAVWDGTQGGTGNAVRTVQSRNILLRIIKP